MKSIQQANIESALKRMSEAKTQKNENSFNSAKSDLLTTLDAIKNADQKTYDKYSNYLKEEY